MCGKQQASEQRGLGRAVQHPAPLVAGQSTSQDGKHVDHEGRDNSVQDDVQDVEADGMQASRQEVVQPEETTQRQRIVNKGASADTFIFFGRIKEQQVT